jgi:hypothetical protein
MVLGLPTLWKIYETAVRAVPSVRIAMGVAGVVAVGAIVMMVANENPQKAAISFLLVISGMLILLIVAGTFSGPRIVLVWTVTIAFVACALMTLTAYAFGCPRNWAEFVGARPDCPWPRAELHHFSMMSARSSRDPGEVDSRAGSSLDLICHMVGAPSKAVDLLERTLLFPILSGPMTAWAGEARESRASGLRPAPMPGGMIVAQGSQEIVESFPVRLSSNDCGINQHQTVSRCLTRNDAVVNLKTSGVSVNSANCGSTVEPLQPKPNAPNCVNIEVVLKGCGYDQFLGLKNCKGRGWINALVTIRGVVAK